MVKTERQKKAEKFVLSLLTKKEYLSTKQVLEKGRAKGGYNNWGTYDKHLETLSNEGKIERLVPNPTVRLYKKK